MVLVLNDRAWNFVPQILLISEILNNDNNGKIKEMTGGGVEADSRYVKSHLNKLLRYI